MKRYLITSPRYTGEAELVYNTKGELIIIDCSQTDMHPGVMFHFKKAAPVLESELQKAFSSEVIIIESEYVVTFEMFWKKYNHKFNKDRCEGLWNKLSKSNQITAFFGLDKYLKFRRKNPEHYIMHPDTWLRSKGWGNDYK